MSVTLMLAGAILAQSTPLTVIGSSADRSDVAFEELVAGQNREAVERILASDLASRRDPCALINLGTAHARLGDKQKAASLYKAAIASRDRYDLELADGTWLDSRRAARRAVAGLKTGQLVALR